MSKGDILSRLDDHLLNIEWFDRAILIREDRGMNSATAGYLEGRLHDLCREAVFVEHVDRRDFDESKPSTEEEQLEAIVVPVLRGVLELVGIPLDRPEDVAQLRSLEPRRGDRSQRPLK